MRAPVVSGVILVAAVLLLAGCTAPPAPEPEPDWGLSQVADPLPLEQLAAFSGVVMLNTDADCTGTLVDTGVPDGPAWVLTNGHCAGDLGRFDQQTTIGAAGVGHAVFLRAAGNLDATYSRDVVEVGYSTMRFTDTALVRLEGTLGELQALGLRAVPIADDEPAPGDEVVNVGVPVQHLDEDDRVLRRGECTLGEQQTLIEGSWTWFGAWANDCPGIVQGSSGSPLLRLASDGTPEAIVAVINTTTAGASRDIGGPCFLQQPCEMHDGEARLVVDTSYAQSVAGIGRCLDAATGELTFGEGCPLPRGDVWVEFGGGPFRGGDLPDGVGRLPRVSLIGEEAGTVRTALVPFGDGRACLDPETYAGAEQHDLPQAGERWEVVGLELPVTLPEVEGRYHLCAVRGEAYDRAAAVLFEVDRTPPRYPASAEVLRGDDGSVFVQPHFNPPEIGSVRFTWGPKGEVDCTDTAAFEDFLIVPVAIAPDELPATYCLYGMDFAGNPSEVTVIDIPRS
ncbi:trypsin-like serine peptidase [Protaetiibacter intestinalis]|uniref:Uncharacterized protein n=1 Tax=Protaetiibacter intestinalis TaxID=2419774 RepID=A0A387BE09_9MICO|nr:trypsin-like peptidase domain-containing protein [Protaetiibacter intestinalis]AYF99139.1 hypothetical protein D7I47_13310 [Protaetiibacter intestinalis]